jgi:hypothetical protein
MSNLYTATANLHKAVQEKAKKLGLEIEIKSDIVYLYLSNGSLIQCYNNFNEGEDNYWNVLSTDGNEYQNYGPIDSTDTIPAIQAPQICQILLAFQKVLGENPEYRIYINTAIELQTNQNRHGSSEELYESTIDKDTLKHAIVKRHGEEDSVSPNELRLQRPVKTQAEALCAKYLDGLNPMFDREPEKVLEELTTIINNI